MKILRKILPSGIMLAALSMSAPGYAHHSFAVHFVGDEIVTLSGVVTSFSFSNPHGLVKFTVTDESGTEVAWQAETNSPNMLRRRGWARNSVKAGDHVIIDGYPTRDGSPYVRINRLTFADGSELFGQGRAMSDPNQQD